jgi:chitinase
LHNDLADPFTLPPKRILSTTFIPSAWVDDSLITERKAGLWEYLNALLSSPDFQGQPALAGFLTSQEMAPATFNAEDALPSTLSRKDALKLQEGLSTEAADVTPIACAYYPDWATSPSIADINYSLYDVIFFGRYKIQVLQASLTTAFPAFATPNSSSTIDWDSGSQSQLQQLVSAAHGSGHSTKVCLSIGGWGGSYWFSQAMGSSANRTTFINAIASAVSTYDLDGKYTLARFIVSN